MALTDQEYEQVMAKIEVLERGPSRPQQIVSTAYFDVIRILLKKEDFITRHITLGAAADDPDLIAEKKNPGALPKTRLAAQFKYYGNHLSSVPQSAVARLLASPVHAFDRVMLVANRPFDSATRTLAATAKPVAMELLDLSRLRVWAEGLKRIASDVEAGVTNLTVEFTRRFALMIAEKPEELRQVSWRKAEEILGEVFDGLGFEVEVTPWSKDGGKDLICTYTLKGHKRTFYVEVKHHKTKVTRSLVKSFVEVVGKDKVDQGLFISTGGYGPSAFKVIAEVERPVALGSSTQFVDLCRLYKQSRSGLLQPIPDKWDLATVGATFLSSATKAED